MSSEPSIEFFCAICGLGLSVDAVHSGALVECSSCARVIPVPGILPRPEGGAYRRAYSAEILSVEITFVCPACERALVADARLEGADFLCPKCGLEGLVPVWSGRSAEAGESGVPTVVLSADEMDFLSGEAPLPLFPEPAFRSAP